MFPKNKLCNIKLSALINKLILPTLTIDFSNFMMVYPPNQIIRIVNND